MIKLQVLVIPESVYADKQSDSGDVSHIGGGTNDAADVSTVAPSTSNVFRYSTPDNAMNSSMIFARPGSFNPNASYMFPPSYITPYIQQLTGNKIKKFLHITSASNNLETVACEIGLRFQKLYPNEDPLNILKIQNSEECDLDPDYVVSMVFDTSNVCRVIVSNEFSDETSSTGKRILNQDLNKVMKKRRSNTGSENTSIWNSPVPEDVYHASTRSTHSSKHLNKPLGMIDTEPDVSAAIPDPEDTVIHPSKNRNLKLASPIIATGSPTRITSGMLNMQSQPDLSKVDYEEDTNGSIYIEQDPKRASVPSKEDRDHDHAENHTSTPFLARLNNPDSSMIHESDISSSSIKSPTAKRSAAKITNSSPISVVIPGDNAPVAVAKGNKKQKVSKAPAANDSADKNATVQSPAKAPTDETVAKTKASEKKTKTKTEEEKLKEKEEKEKAKAEKAALKAKEKAEKAERLAKEKAEKAERVAREKAEKAEKIAKEKAEKAEKLAKEKAEKAAKEKAEKAAKEKNDKTEKANVANSAKEKVANAEKTATGKGQKEKAAEEKVVKNKTESDLVKEQGDKQKPAKKTSKDEAKKSTVEKAVKETEKVAKANAAKDKPVETGTEKSDKAKTKEKAEQEKLEKESTAKEKVAKEKEEKDKAEKAERERIKAIADDEDVAQRAKEHAAKMAKEIAERLTLNARKKATQEKPETAKKVPATTKNNTKASNAGANGKKSVESDIENDEDLKAIEQLTREDTADDEKLRNIAKPTKVKKLTVTQSQKNIETEPVSSITKAAVVNQLSQKKPSKSDNKAVRAVEISGEIDKSNILPPKPRGSKIIKEILSSGSDSEVDSEDSSDDSSDEEETSKPKVVTAPSNAKPRTVSQNHVSTTKPPAVAPSKVHVEQNDDSSSSKAENSQPLSKCSTLPRLSAFIDKKLPEVRMQKQSQKASAEKVASESDIDTDSDSDTDTDSDTDSDSDSDADNANSSKFINSKTASQFVTTKKPKSKGKKNSGFSALMKDFKK